MGGVKKSAKLNWRQILCRLYVVKDSQGIISTIIRRCDSIRDNQGIGAIYAKSQQKTCHGIKSPE